MVVPLLLVLSCIGLQESPTLILLLWGAGGGACLSFSGGNIAPPLQLLKSSSPSFESPEQKNIFFAVITKSPWAILFMAGRIL